MAGVTADETASGIDPHGAPSHSAGAIPTAISDQGHEHTEPRHHQQQQQQPQPGQHQQQPAYEPQLSRETAQAAAAWGGAGVAAGQQTSQEDLFSHVILLEEEDGCGPVSIQKVR